MSFNTPKTIEIFLPEGDPKGMKIATITSRNVEVAYIPRKKLNVAKNRQNLGSVGMYILVGESEKHQKQEVYIGEAENCMTRISQHNASKDFWGYALIVTSRTNQFTKTHGKYLEWLSCQTAREAKRCVINNSVVPSKPYTSEAMEAELQDSFDTISILISTLGLPIFQPAISIKREDDNNQIFEAKRHNIVGRGQYTDEGFVVLKGSQFHKKTTVSLSSGIDKKRQDMLSDGVLLEKDKCYELIEDYLFSSPSTAAACVTGRSSNGWTAWVLPNGDTLSDVYRTQKEIKPNDEELMREEL